MSEFIEPPVALHTIGYEGFSIEEFLDVLSVQGIDVLIDVRELPLSRKPGFSKKSLSQALDQISIKYIHLRNLGAPKTIRHALRENGDWEVYCKAYKEVLDANKNALVKIADIAHQQRVTLMCFERDFQTCHRSLVAERMRNLNLVLRIKHLNPKKEKIVVDALGK